MFWLDGRISAQSDRQFDLRDRGLLLGDGLFETIAVSGRVPFQLTAHLNRLAASAQHLRIALDLDLARRAIVELVAAFEQPDGVLRLTLTRGQSERGLALPLASRPCLFASMAAWTPTETVDPVGLATSSIRRNPTSPTSRHKTLNYLDQITALDEARAKGADDALLLSFSGRAACASAANLFVIKDRTLRTPPIADGVLPGCIRSLLLANAYRFNLVAVEDSLRLQDVRQADAVLLTNSLRMVRSAVSLDGLALPSDSSLPERLLAWLRDEMRLERGPN